MMNLHVMESATHLAAIKGFQPFTLPELPYGKTDLAPYVSARTIGFHYAKHHQAYVNNLNTLVIDNPWAAGLPLEKLVLESAGRRDAVDIFNNAALAWNHEFFWMCMKPNGGGKPTGRLLEMIATSFGGFEKFKEAFVAAALKQYGRGWIWLVQEGDALKIVNTVNADTPMAHEQTALITCDLWEHAYYLDYENRRKDFVQAFLDRLANWEFAAAQLK